MYALPEGTVAYPHVQMVRIECDLVGAILIETYLLQTMNFHRLIATKMCIRDSIDGGIVELLVLHIEDIILYRFLCDGMNGLFCIPQKPKEASALCGVEVE